MYDDILNLLKKNEIIISDGLTPNEINQIRDIYNLEFPNSLKSFFLTALPISRGFYNWRDFSDCNISFIKEAINYPIKDIYDRADEVYWCEDWGAEPSNKQEFIKRVRQKLQKAPRLIPIFSHRYIPAINKIDPPILSIQGVDVIYYGENLKNYFNIEFGDEKQEYINFEKVPHIPFWSELI